MVVLQLVERQQNLQQGIRFIPLLQEALMLVFISQVERYTNVMTGMPDANLHSTVSGTLTGDGTNSVGTVNWALTETSSGSNNWNLTTSGGSYTYIGKDNTQSAINQTTKNVGGVFQNVSAGGNFANMTTYDCNLFDGKENCISVGGRVTESSGTDTSLVLVAGQKINENLRIGGYIDQTINHDNYNDININVNVPLIGAMAVWNESADQQGLQLKFSNSYQSNDAEITRAVGAIFRTCIKGTLQLKLKVILQKPLTK